MLRNFGITKVNVFKYFGVNLLAGGSMKQEANHKTDKGNINGWYTDISAEI